MKNFKVLILMALIITGTVYADNPELTITNNTGKTIMTQKGESGNAGAITFIMNNESQKIEVFNSTNTSIGYAVRYAIVPTISGIKRLSFYDIKKNKGQYPTALTATLDAAGDNVIFTITA